jgi:hypothetical protein
MAHRLLSFCAILSFAFWAERPGFALAHDPGPAWTTLETEHFDVHYPEGLEDLAPRTAAICERRWHELDHIFGFHPDTRIQVELTDEFDEANGETNAFPYENILLITAPMDEEREVWDVDVWLDMLISHEMTHAFHLDHARGVPKALRSVLGRSPLTFPAQYQPDWIIEGLAVWAETDRARGVGRAQSAFYRGMLRLDALDGFRTLRRVNVPQRKWPYGDAIYLYGSFFMEFLEDRYGVDKLRQWVQSYSGFWIPYFINLNAQLCFGKELPALWSEYRDWATASLLKEAQTRKVAGLRGSVAPQGDNGFWGPYKGGFALRWKLRGRPCLERYADGVWTPLGEAFAATFSPGKGRLLYTEDEVVRQSLLVRDLWEMDETTGKRHRLTHALRVQDAVETPKGIVALLGSRGQKNLVLLGEDGRPLETLWEGHDEENLASLCVSPDGGKIAASFWRRGQGWDIGEFDLTTRVWSFPIGRPEDEVQPSYSADGRFLFFSAAYGGVFDVWALERASGRLIRVTRVEGAALHPWPGPHDLIYFSQMTSEGWTLGQVAFDPEGLPEDLPAPAPRPQAKPLEALPPASLKLSPYRPWTTLAPTFWQPFAYGDSTHFYAGALTAGQDALGRHALDALVYWESGLGEPLGEADYSYTRWYPQITADFSRTLSQQEPAWGGTYARTLLNQSCSLSVDLPWNGTWRNWDASLSWGIDAFHDVGGDAALAAWTAGQSRAWAATASYDSTTQQNFDLGPVDGLQASLGFDQVFGGPLGDQSWISWNLARPTRLGPVELEASTSGGAAASGDTLFQLADGEPAALAKRPGPRFAPVYSFAGYGTDDPDLTRADYCLGHLGLRIPLNVVDWGLMAPPVALDRMWCRVWAESAEAGGPTGSSQNLKDSIGAELDLDHILFYAIGLELRIGVAHGVDLGGESDSYIQLLSY